MKRKLLITIIACFILCGCHPKITLDNGNKDVKPSSKKEAVLSPDAKKLLNQGIKKLNQGNIDAAILDFKDLTGLYPDFSIGYYNLGLAYAKNNQINEAVSIWEEFKTLDKNYADVYFNLGQAYQKIKNNKKAVQNLEKYLQLRPNDPLADKIREEIAKLREPSLGKGIIGRVAVTEKVDLKDKVALDVRDLFSPKTPVIYSCIEVLSAPKNTVIYGKWYYRGIDNKRVPVNSVKFIMSGTKNILLSLKKPKTDWPEGRYEFVVYVNKKENLIVPFNIQE